MGRGLYIYPYQFPNKRPPRCQKGHYLYVEHLLFIQFWRGMCNKSLTGKKKIGVFDIIGAKKERISINFFLNIFDPNLMFFWCNFFILISHWLSTIVLSYFISKRGSNFDIYLEGIGFYNFSFFWIDCQDLVLVCRSISCISYGFWDKGTLKCFQFQALNFFFSQNDQLYN